MHETYHGGGYSIEINLLLAKTEQIKLKELFQKYSKQFLSSGHLCNYLYYRGELYFRFGNNTIYQTKGKRFAENPPKFSYANNWEVSYG